jgi:hypothetical protein
VRRSGHASHIVKSHKVQSVKSCESAGESAETVGGESVVMVGVGGKDRIVIKKVGYAQRCRGLSCVRIVSPKSNARGSDLSPFSLSSRPAGRPCAARRRCPVPLCSSQPRAPRRPVGGGGMC